MSVQSTISKAGPFIADGSQLEFTFRFSVIDLDHIAVYRNGVLVARNEYETYAMGTGPVDETEPPVEGDELTGDMSRGGYILFSEPPPSGAKIVILRKVPLTQETDIQNNTAFNPEILETAYDKLTMIAQQLSEEIDRSIKVGVGETDANPDALLAGIYGAADAARTSATEAQQKANEAANAAGYANAAADEANSAKESVKDSAEAVQNAADEALEKFDEMLEKTAGLPLGSIFLSPSGAPPEGAYLLNGQEIKQCHTLYPKFWEWLTSQIEFSEDGNPRVVALSRYKPWAMPALTADGTLGGADYAVEASGNTSSGYEAYKSFDGTPGGAKTYASIPSTKTGSLTWYSPVKIRVSSVVFQNPSTVNTSYMPKNIVIEGSNDGVSWTELAVVDYESRSANATQTVGLEASSKKYFRFTVTNNGGANTDFPEITLYGKEFLYTDSFFKQVNNTDVLITDDVEVYERILREHGACGAFFVDPWSHRVRLPDWRNAYPLYTGISRDSGLSTPGYPGDTIPAGLPNIEGEYIHSSAYNVSSISGAFSRTEVASNLSGDSSGGSMDNKITFDASRCSPVYGNSDTVRPLSISAAWCIQVFNAATALSELESAKLATQIQLKADTSLFNVDSDIDFVIESWNDGAGNWYRKYRSGWVEQGGSTPKSTAGGTVTFPVEFADTNYTVATTKSTRSNTQTDTGGVDSASEIGSYTTTGFHYSQQNSSMVYTQWVAKGKAAN